MTFTTKYNKGEKVWIMNNNLPQERSIIGMRCCDGNCEDNAVLIGSGIVEYFLNGSKSQIVQEKLLFKTKQELLNSL